MFLECLYYNGVKLPQMANYLSAIKSKFIIFGLDVACFSDHRLKYYQKAIQLHAPLQVKLNKIIDVKLLKEIVMGRYKNMYIGRSPMQNRTDSGIPRFSTPQRNMDVSSSRHRNKSGQMHEI